MISRSLFHTFCFALFIVVCIADYIYVKPEFLPIPGVFASKFVWLTLIDLYMQAIYHFIGIFVGNKRRIPSAFTTFGQALVGPVGMTVVVLFWALYLFDPDTLLADDNAKAIISIAWYNHGLHTLPLVTVLVEILLFSREKLCAKKALVIISGFAALYIADIHYVHHISGFWAYPILGFLSFPFRMLFIAVCISVIFANYMILSFVYNSVHGNMTSRKLKHTKIH